MSSRMPEPENPQDKRVLERRLTSRLTGATNISRMIIILPSTRYVGYRRQGWVDVSDQVTPEEIAALPMPSWFDGM